jgi:hypothetical protein
VLFLAFVVWLGVVAARVFVALSVMVFRLVARP